MRSGGLSPKGVSGPRLLILAAILAAVGVITTTIVPGTKTRGEEPAPAARGEEDPASWLSYAEVLSRVDDLGMVDYSGLKRNRGALDRFVELLADFDERIFSDWDESHRIAFWFNAYNGLTIRAIVDNYPIQPSILASLRFPRNSIRQIPGVWDRLRFTVMGRQLTLDDIEHKILRIEFDEPRLHLALVCAARSCPPLRGEPYLGRRLEDQMDDQTRRFLADPGKFRIDRRERRVSLSPIFRWYGEDFVGRFSPETGFDGRGEVEKAVLNFISGYLAEPDEAYLRTGDYTIRYLGYDWTLNESLGER